MGFSTWGVDCVLWWLRESEISMHPGMLMLILVLHQIFSPNWVYREQLMSKPQIWFVSHTFNDQAAVHHMGQHSCSALRAEAPISLGTTGGPLRWCHSALIWVSGSLFAHQSKLGFPRAAGQCRLLPTDCQSTWVLHVGKRNLVLNQIVIQEHLHIISVILLYSGSNWNSFKWINNRETEHIGISH